MKEKILFVGVISLILGLAPIIEAQESAVGNPTPGAELPKAPPEIIKNKINGTVEGVGADGQSLQLKQSSGSVTLLRIDTGTEIRRDGKVVGLSELKAGDKVTVKIP